MRYFERIKQEVSSSPNVSTNPHRFGGKEFRFGTPEIGHIHAGEDVDIPFPRSVRDALLADGLAEEHRWVPNSGWITFQVRDEGDIKHAVWLMRLSYLRYALKAASDPRRVLDEYGEELQLSLNTNRSRTICSRRSRSVATDSQRRRLSFRAQRSPERLKDPHDNVALCSAFRARNPSVVTQASPRP